jgi:hypothetical protein
MRLLALNWLTAAAVVARSIASMRSTSATLSVSVSVSADADASAPPWPFPLAARAPFASSVASVPSHTRRHARVSAQPQVLSTPVERERGESRRSREQGDAAGPYGQHTRGAR